MGHGGHGLSPEDGPPSSAGDDFRHHSSSLLADLAKDGVLDRDDRV
jgi:hypothetical protein